MSNPKKSKNDTNDDISRNKSMLDKILGDVAKSSSTKQILIGASTGW